MSGTTGESNTTASPGEQASELPSSITKPDTESSYTDPLKNPKIQRRLFNAYVDFLQRTLCMRCKQEVHPKHKVRYSNGVYCVDCWNKSGVRRVKSVSKPKPKPNQ
jgi:hypothetical protein